MASGLSPKIKLIVNRMIVVGVAERISEAMSFPLKVSLGSIGAIRRFAKPFPSLPIEVDEARSENKMQPIRA